MSMLCFLEIGYMEELTIDVDEQREKIHSILDESGYDIAALNDFRDAFSDGSSEFGGSADGLLIVVEKIAALFPTVKFQARGTGEEFRDTWVREFDGGQALFAVGPWYYDEN